MKVYGAVCHSVRASLVNYEQCQFIYNSLSEEDRDIRAQDHATTYGHTVDLREEIFPDAR